jgi:hypothetical protein
MELNGLERTTKGHSFRAEQSGSVLGPQAGLFHNIWLEKAEGESINENQLLISFCVGSDEL